jgi:hypothetical protein
MQLTISNRGECGQDIVKANQLRSIIFVIGSIRKAAIKIKTDSLHIDLPDPVNQAPASHY